MKEKQIEEMEHCEDCIHYAICIFHLKGDENKSCPHFENKAGYRKQSEGVNTFVKIYYDFGSGGIERLENAINEFARKRNLDIVSANPCFRKCLLDADGMFIVVVFRKKGGEGYGAKITRDYTPHR